MKFKNNSEFRDAFNELSSIVFYDKQVDAYEFLDLYLQVAECKKIVFSRSQEIFLFPDYDKQIYETGIEELFKRLDQLAKDCNIPSILQMYTEQQVLVMLKASSSIKEAEFAPRHLIQTNRGVIDTITRKKSKLTLTERLLLHIRLTRSSLTMLILVLKCCSR